MNIIYPVNYVGYFPIQRSIFTLVREQILTLSQLGSYICFVAQADFDSKHRYYSSIIRDDAQLANEFGINHTTIYRHRKELIKSGLLTEENSVTKITNYRMFELEWAQKLARRSIQRPIDLFLSPQKDAASFEQLIANLQSNQGKIVTKGSNSNVSFKGDTSRDNLWLDGKSY